MTVQQILSSSHCDNIKIYIDDKLVNQAIFSPSLCIITTFFAIAADAEARRHRK